MKINDFLPYLRQLLNDKDSQAFRYSDGALILHVQDALRLLSQFRKDLFVVADEFGTFPGNVLQKLPDDVEELIEILAVVGGNNLREATKESMDIEVPTWSNDPAGPTKHWMREERSTRLYYIYPKAPTTQQLVALVVKIPQPTTLTEEFEFNKMYLSALEYATVFLAQTIDDEHISTGRAKMFYDMMKETLGIDKQAHAAGKREGSVNVQEV